jgi:hypothetical protein
MTAAQSLVGKSCASRIHIPPKRQIRCGLMRYQEANRASISCLIASVRRARPLPSSSLHTTGSDSVLEAWRTGAILGLRAARPGEP